MALVDIETLARWTQNDLAEVTADPFAADLLDKVSQFICYVAGHPEWHTDGGAPIDVYMVALGVVKRSYENPGRIIQETTGPLGERVIEPQALFTDLSDEERAVLEKHNPNVAVDPNAGLASVFTLSIDTTSATPMGDVIYATDNQQVNLGTTQSWDVPLLDSGDVPA